MSSEVNDASLMKLLVQARNFDVAHLLIVGDFNFPGSIGVIGLHLREM